MYRMSARIQRSQNVEFYIQRASGQHDAPLASIQLACVYNSSALFFEGFEYFFSHCYAGYNSIYKVYIVNQ
jgi:hypothetical protein